MAGKNLFHLKLPWSILFISFGNRHEQIGIIVIVITSLVIIINNYFFGVKRWPFHVKALIIYLLSDIFEISQEIILT